MSLSFFDSDVHLPGCLLPLRSTLVREGSSSILIGPGHLSTQDFEQIAREGGVTDLVAPSLFHHLFFQRAVECFPNARRWGVDGFKNKRPDIAWTDTLTQQHWPHGDTLPALELPGMPRVNEVVFLHRHTRTLIVTDLCYNVLQPRGWAAPIFLGAFGTFRRFAVSRLFKACIKERDGKAILRDALVRRNLL